MLGIQVSVRYINLEQMERYEKDIIAFTNSGHREEHLGLKFAYFEMAEILDSIVLLGFRTDLDVAQLDHLAHTIKAIRLTQQTIDRR